MSLLSGMPRWLGPNSSTGKQCCLLREPNVPAHSGVVGPDCSQTVARRCETGGPQLSLFCRFPVWLGQNSSAGKQRRLLGELHTRMASSGAFQGDRSALRLSYLPVLQRTLLAPLAEHGKEGIEAVVEEVSSVAVFCSPTCWDGHSAYTRRPVGTHACDCLHNAKRSSAETRHMQQPVLPPTDLACFERCSGRPAPASAALHAAGTPGRLQEGGS